MCVVDNYERTVQTSRTSPECTAVPTRVVDAGRVWYVALLCVSCKVVLIHVVCPFSFTIQMDVIVLELVSMRYLDAQFDNEMNTGMCAQVTVITTCREAYFHLRRIAVITGYIGRAYSYSALCTLSSPHRLICGRPRVRLYRLRNSAARLVTGTGRPTRV